MTSPSEKHMEASAEICSRISEFGEPAQETIATALAHAEREGMRRAAEIVEEFGRNNGASYECGIMRRDILSEIGDET